MNALKLMAYLGLDSSEYESGLNKATGKATKFGKVSAMVFGAFMEVGRRAASAVFNSISTNMDGAVKRFDTLNNFPKVMESLGFEAKESSKAINDLANGIGHLPTTLDAVASQAQQIVPMTGDIEKATQVTLALNNAMAAGGKEAYVQQNAIAQWTKAMAKGKPDFEMWQSMVQAAPAQMDQLAKSIMGANANQNDLYEAMKSGSISVGEVNDKMIELTNASEGFDIAGKHYDNFAKQAENASAGIQMSMINVRAAIQRNLANILQSANDIFGPKGIAGAIQGIVPVIDKVGESISGMLSGDISFEGGITSLLNGFAKGAREAIHSGSDIITNLMNGMAEALPSLIEQASLITGNIRHAIAKELPDLLSAGANLVGGLIKGVSKGLPAVVDGAISIIDSLTSSVDANAEAFISKGLDLLLGLSENIRAGAGTLVDSGLALIVSLAQGIANSLPELISKVPTIVSNIAGVINDNAPKVVGAAFTIIKTLALGLIKAIPTLIVNIPQILMAIWDVFTAFNWLELGGTVVTKIGSGIKSFAQSLPTAMSDLGGRAVEAFINIPWGNVGSTAVKLIGNAIKGLASLPGQMLRKAASLGIKAFTGVAWGNVGRTVLNGIAKGISAAVSLVTAPIKSLIKKIKGYFPFSVGKIFSGWVPKIKLTSHKSGDSASTSAQPAGSYKFARAMAQPYMFSKPTNFMAGEAGDEMLYGKSALMHDLREAVSGVSTGQSVVINNYITVEGAESPEDFAERLVRKMKLDMRAI